MSITRRSFLGVLGASAATFGLAACGSTSSSSTSTSGSGSSSSSSGDISGLTVAFIPKVTGNAFFESANDGAQEHAKDWNITVDYIGDSTASVSAQVTVINQAVANCAYKVPSEEMRQEKVDEVIAYKQSRNYDKLGPCFARLYNDTKDGVNISEAVIAGVKEGMTYGEMCGIVRLGYGLCYDPMETLPTPDYVVESLKECEK